MCGGRGSCAGGPAWTPTDPGLDPVQPDPPENGNEIVNNQSKEIIMLNKQSITLLDGIEPHR
jgi:hypothetical protein